MVRYLILYCETSSKFANGSKPPVSRQATRAPPLGDGKILRLRMFLFIVWVSKINLYLHVRQLKNIRNTNFEKQTKKRKIIPTAQVRNSGNVGFGSGKAECDGYLLCHFRTDTLHILGNYFLGYQVPSQFPSKSQNLTSLFDFFSINQFWWPNFPIPKDKKNGPKNEGY